MDNAASAVWASIVRTIVPIIVGAVLSWLTAVGISADAQFPAQLTNLLTVAFSGLYYVIVRLLETYATPKLGWLLGLARTPAAYTPESPAKATPVDVVVATAAAGAKVAGAVPAVVVPPESAPAPPAAPAVTPSPVIPTPAEATLPPVTPPIV